MIFKLNDSDSDYDGHGDVDDEDNDDRKQVTKNVIRQFYPARGSLDNDISL